MSIKIRNVHIENCGTGIKAIGKVDMDIKDITFKDNNKDMDFFVESNSNISIDKLTSNGCKTDSLTYAEYSNKLSKVKELVDSKTNDFTSGGLTIAIPLIKKKK